MVESVETLEVMSWPEAERAKLRYRCSVCGSEPQAFPVEGGYEVRCNRGHKGLVRQKSATRVWKEGGEVPTHIKNVLERKYGGERMDSTALTEIDKKTMVQRITFAQKQFGFAISDTGGSRALTIDELGFLAEYCRSYGFDPMMGEVCLYHGRPYIMIDGLRRKAQETGLYRGCRQIPVTDPEEKVALGYSRGDIVFKCVVLKSESDGYIGEYERYGGVTQEEREEKSRGDSTKLRNPVLAKRTSDMAQNRAERDALRVAFSFRFPGVEGPPLDVSYRVVDEKPAIARKERKEIEGAEVVGGPPVDELQPTEEERPQYPPKPTTKELATFWRDVWDAGFAKDDALKALEIEDINEWIEKGNPLAAAVTRLKQLKEPLFGEQGTDERRDEEIQPEQLPF